MEHLQKIPYLLSFFVPIALFFGLGLWLAHWIWYKHARRLQLGLRENEVLNADLAKIQAGKLSAVDVDAIEGEWQAKLDDKELELNARNAELEAKTSELADLNLNLSNKDNEFSGLNTQLLALQAGEKAFSTKFEAEQQKVADLDLKLGNLSADKDKEYNLLLESKNALQAKVDGSAKIASDLEAKLEQTQSDYDRLQVEHKASSNTITNLVAKVNDLEKAKLDVAADADAIGSLEAKVSDLEGQLGGKDSEILTLKADLDSAQAASAEASGIEAKLAALTGQLGGKDSQILSLQADLDSAKGASVDTSAFDAKISGLEGQLAGKDSEIDSLKGQLDAKDAEVTSAKASADSASANSVDVSSLAPAAFFAGSGATNHDRYGHIFDGNKPSYSDKLTDIKGVGEVLEPTLNKYGVYQFKQIALWDQDNIDAFQTDLDFPGRVERDQWVNQAADLHRNTHGEHLAPVVDIYHPAPKAKASAAVLSSYEGESVKEDEDLGIIYTSRPDEVDDLKLIKGVANVLEGRLHEFGIYRFKQIVHWTESHMEEFSDRLSFSGRIQRDNWQEQAAQFHKEKYGANA